jgi:PAS domain S-box-containing protein
MINSIKNRRMEEIKDLQQQLEQEKQKNAELKKRLSKKEALLKERNKELSGIFQITQLINDPGNTVDYVLEQSAKILSESYFDPDNTCVRIIHNHISYKTDNFDESQWKQSISKPLDNGRLHLEVYYLGEPSEQGTNPFLSEEHDLLNTVSGELVVYLDRKNGEEKTVQNFQKFRTVFHSVQDAIFIHDLEGNFLEVNNEACSRLNYSRDELLKLTPMDIDEKTHAEKAPRIFKQLNDEGRYKGETIHITKEGEKINTELNSVKINYDGKPAILTVARDITQRKQYEKELMDAKNKAEESAKLKSAFLANLSHEIRTPLNAILGFTDLLESENLDREKKKEFIDTIKASGNNLLSIINDILDVSFIESEQIQIDQQEFSLNVLMETLKAETEHKIATRRKSVGLTTHKEFADGKDYLVADPGKIQQIFTKLLDNAVKFTNSGSIEFGYRRENGSNIDFYVKDTGIGVPESSKSLVFERFRQLDIGVDRQFEGLGLGLPIAKGLVTQLGGTIEFNSLENKGTTVTFKLPYRSREDSSSEEDITQLHNDMSDKTILVAEDDESNYLLVNELLINAKIMHAGNGSRAVEICKDSDHIDLVLMDIKMPVMDGMEAMKKIKELKPDLPVIALTAYAYADDKSRFLEAGFDEYLSKPVSQKELIDVVEKYV